MGESTPVLVVGGGLSGLASAAFLAAHGVRCLVIERRAQVAGARTRGASARNHRLSVRTMELLRAHGLERAVREAGFDPDQIGDTRFSSGPTRSSAGGRARQAARRNGRWSGSCAC